MFTEILRIKPVLDPAAATQMENNLGGRFRRITNSFGRGLKGAIKGSFVGVSLAMLARFLNPLEKIEEKIRKLLDEAKAQGDLSDEFNTSPGKLRAIQDVAGTLGVTPDSLKEVMNKYAQAVEKAREELKDPTAKFSDSTLALKNFAGDKDVAESFLQFIQSLKSVGLANQGVGEILTKDGTRKRTGIETRQDIERAVFGEVQKGQSKRLIDSNLVKAFQRQPATVNQLDSAYSKLSAREQQDRNARINRETSDLIRSSRNITPSVVSDINAAEQRRTDKENRDFANFEALKKAQEAVDELNQKFEGVQKLILLAARGWADIIDFITKFKQSRWFRMYNGGGK